jgi:hypothetical protein
MLGLTKTFNVKCEKKDKTKFYALSNLLCSCMNIVYMFVCSYRDIFIEISRWYVARILS